MVLSTLHTNSAAGALTRLVDLGVPEFVVREVLRGVLAQDLVGVSCSGCGGAGCGVCGGTGVSGRRLEVVRGGCGKLNIWDKWFFRATAA